MARGVVFWQGPSLLTSEPIVGIATGLDGKSKNRKTGPMVQTWILRADVHPRAERRLATYTTSAICGTCPMRGTFGACYVAPMGPNAIYRSYTSGQYEEATPFDVVPRFPVRVGSYGDPAAVPTSVWEALLTPVRRWTGYTHQWRTADPALARICQASVESVKHAREAQAAGWRTYRVSADGVPDPTLKEIACPAARGMTSCALCGLCGGTSVRAPNIVVKIHGSRKANWRPNGPEL